VLVVLDATRDPRRWPDDDVECDPDANHDAVDVSVDRRPGTLLRPAPQVELLR